MAYSTQSDVAIPENLERRIDAWKGIGALVWCGVFGWFTLVHLGRVPVWELAMIGTHESGHLIFGFTHNDLITLVMGNGFETALPLVAAAVFLIRKRNWVACGMCLAWCANTLTDASLYIYDAPRGLMPLIGIGPVSDGGTQQLGDWARILGPEHFDKLFLADPISRDVQHAAVLVWVLSLAVLAGGLAWNHRRLVRLEGGPAATRHSPAEPTPPIADVGPEEMWR